MRDGPGTVEVRNGLVARVKGACVESTRAGVPLWLIGAPVHARLDPLPGKPPYELADAVQLAIDAGAGVSAIQVGRIRQLTDVVDLVRENVPYLR